MDAAGLKPIKDESDPIFSLPEGAEAAEWDNLLWQGWRAFNAGERPGWIRASILSSWQRSRQRGIDPDDFVYCAPPADALAAILAANADLIAVARSVMENLLAYNPDGHINLTDATASPCITAAPTSRRSAASCAKRFRAPTAPLAACWNNGWSTC